jgi:hypothetical protein
VALPLTFVVRALGWVRSKTLLKHSCASEVEAQHLMPPINWMLVAGEAHSVTSSRIRPSLHLCRSAEAKRSRQAATILCTGEPMRTGSNRFTASGALASS